jgi:hypothetical protein
MSTGNEIAVWFSWFSPVPFQAGFKYKSRTRINARSAGDMKFCRWSKLKKDLNIAQPRFTSPGKNYPVVKQQWLRQQSLYLLCYLLQWARRREGMVFKHPAFGVLEEASLCDG